MPSPWLDEMIDVLREIEPRIIITMQIFRQTTLDKFSPKIGDHYPV